MRKLLLFALVMALAAVFAAPALAARKPTIGVAEFKNESGAGWWRGGMGWELSGLVASELASTGDFRVVERSKLEHVLREQDLSASGRIAPGTRAKIGKITGAKYLVLGTVTSYEEEVSGGGGGFSIGPVRLGGKKEEAYIAVDLRVVDTTTGEISYVRTIEANSSGGGLSVGLTHGLFSGDVGGFAKTPAGKAVRACVVHIVEYLQCVMVYRDGCEQDYKAADQRRRKKTKSSISLDE